MEKATAIKAAVTTFFAAVSAIIGWFGWLIVALVIAMTIDYLTGWWAAVQDGTWSSRIAKKGITKKAVILLIIGATGLVDLIIGMVAAQAGMPLPAYLTALISPLVAIWYLLAEIGSILENAKRMGVDMPPFLLKIINIMKGMIEKKGDPENGKEE